MKTILAFFLIMITFSLSAQETKRSEKSMTAVNSSDTKNQNQALIIVDGIKFYRKDSSNILDSIKPENIERMDVMKGEQAILQYGEEGKDGVIVITTKASIKKEPLYIVDGVKTKNIIDLDPNDIESINVLKGKASTSQYGDEGEAGVILITTKNSKKQNKN